MHARALWVVGCMAVVSAIDCPAGSYCTAGSTAGTCDTSLQKGYLYAYGTVATYDLNTMAVTSYCANNGGTCDVTVCTFLDMCTIDGINMYVADGRTKVMKLRLSGGVSSTLVLSAPSSATIRRVAVTPDEKYLFYYDMYYMTNRWIRFEIATGVAVDYADNMMFSAYSDMVVLADGVNVLYAKRYLIYRAAIEDASTATLVAGSGGCRAGIGTAAGFTDIDYMVLSNSGTMVAISDYSCKKIFKLVLATMEVSILYSPGVDYTATSMAFGPGDEYLDILSNFRLMRLDMTTLQVTTFPALTLNGQSLNTDVVYTSSPYGPIKGITLFAGGPACAQPPPTQTPCVAGQYCPSGSSQPGVCPAGSVCANASIIEPCPVDSYCPAGSTSPTPCPAATHSVDGAATASECICPNGLRLLDSQCATCPPDSFCQNNTATVCPPGTTSLANATSYLDCWCRPGTVGNTVNATAANCVPCPAGHMCAADRVSVECGC